MSPSFWLGEYSDEMLRERVADVDLEAQEELHVWIGFAGVDLGLNVDPLIALLQECNLKSLVLYGDPEMDQFGQALALRFLQTVSRLSTLLDLTCSNLAFPIQEFVTIIDSQTGGVLVEKLCMHGCIIEFPPDYDIAQSTDAFRRNTSLKSFELTERELSTSLLPIRSGIQANTSIEELVFTLDTDYETEDVTQEAIGELLNVTSSVKNVTLYGCDVNGAILHSIAGNGRFESITFKACDMSEGSAEHFRSMLISKSNVKRLHFDNSWIPDLLAIMPQVLGADSSVRHLSLTWDDNWIREVEWPAQEGIEEMLRLLENGSKLESLELGEVDTPDMVAALAASIPKMRLKTFGLYVHSDVEHLTYSLMLALKQNTRIFDAYSNFERPYYNELEGYCARNRFLCGWIANPNSVSLNLVPRAARACAHSGDYTALFQSLRNNVDAIVLAFRQRHPNGPVDDDDDDTEGPTARVDIQEENHAQEEEQVAQQQEQQQQNRSATNEQIERQKRPISSESSGVVAVTESHEAKEEDGLTNKQRRLL